jgi:hypothetical protein
MQGKFKLVVFPEHVGHVMMEDDPNETAKNLHMFLEKFRVALNVQELEHLNQVGIGRFKNGLTPYC